MSSRGGFRGRGGTAGGGRGGGSFGSRGGLNKLAPQIVANLTKGVQQVEEVSNKAMDHQHKSWVRSIAQIS